MTDGCIKSCSLSVGIILTVN